MHTMIVPSNFYPAEVCFDIQKAVDLHHGVIAARIITTAIAFAAADFFGSPACRVSQTRRIQRKAEQKS